MEYDVNPEYTLSKKQKNGIYLSQEMIDILDEYNIDYLACKNLKELIFMVQKCFDDNDDAVLDNLLNLLNERDYYENYNK